MEEDGRWIPVSWADEIDDTYNTNITVVSTERQGLALDVATILNALNSKVRSLNARDTGDGLSLVAVSLEVHSLSELQSIINRLSGIRGVSQVVRNGASQKDQQ